MNIKIFIKKNAKFLFSTFVSLSLFLTIAAPVLAYVCARTEVWVVDVDTGLVIPNIGTSIHCNGCTYTASACWTNSMDGSQTNSPGSWVKTTSSGPAAFGSLDFSTGYNCLKGGSVVDLNQNDLTAAGYTTYVCTTDGSRFDCSSGSNVDANNVAMLNGTTKTVVKFFYRRTVNPTPIPPTQPPFILPGLPSATPTPIPPTQPPFILPGLPSATPVPAANNCSFSSSGTSTQTSVGISTSNFVNGLDRVEWHVGTTRTDTTETSVTVNSLTCGTTYQATATQYKADGSVSSVVCTNDGTSTGSTAITIATAACPGAQPTATTAPVAPTPVYTPGNNNCYVCDQSFWRKLGGTGSCSGIPLTKYCAYNVSSTFDGCYSNSDLTATLCEPLPTPTPVPPNPNPTPNTNDRIWGDVYIDSNGSDALDLGDQPLSGVAITRGSSTMYSNTNGFYEFAGLLAGSYTVNATKPTGYRDITPTTRTVTLGPDIEVDFLVRGYSISGSVFLDKNKNAVKDGSDTNYNGSVTIRSATGGTANYPVPPDGTYKIGGLAQGTYTVSFNSLPQGYAMTYPLNGTPASYTVTVGSSCATDTTHGSSCDAIGNIASLNFGITNEFPWIQGTGGDIRLDNGINNPVPATAYTSLVGPGGSPGLIYSGDSQYGFCAGQAESATCPERSSTRRWVVGGPVGSFPEKFIPRHPGIMRTSYDYFNALVTQNNVSPTDLATVCGTGGIANCDLSATLPNGVYSANGNVTLTSSTGTYTFPANKNFVILVKGNLTIQENVIVPVGSTATFTVTGDITIDKSIGVASNVDCNPTTHVGCNIEGFYSADGNLIVDSNIVGTTYCGADGSSLDKRLNLQGAYVANAKLTTGRFTNRRDLCVDDPTYPVVSIKERADFLLNAPAFLRRSEYTWHEIAP